MVTVSFKEFSQGQPVTSLGSTSSQKFKPKEPEEPGFLSRASDVLKRSGEEQTQIDQGSRNPISKFVQKAASGARAIGEIGLEGVESLPVVGGVVKKATEKIGETVQKHVIEPLSETPLIKGAAEGYNAIDRGEAEKGPEQVGLDVLEDTSAAGDIANLALGAKGSGEALKATGTLAKKGATEVKEGIQAAFTPSEAELESRMVKNFEKGVKPTISGKGTNQQLRDYNDKVLKAAHTIKDNKANLKYIDEIGDEIEGQNPQNLKQFSDAIEQTKKKVFEDYDKLAKEAGDAGATIDTKPVIDELNVLISNPALRISNPSAIEYAKSLRERFKTQQGEIPVIEDTDLRRGSKTLDLSGKRTAGKETVSRKKEEVELDAKTAQEVIKNLNNSLESFYRNPSYETASHAAVDAMIANQLREALDTAITNIKGAGYQELKNQYGALRSIEKDVVKATLRDARKNQKGLIDFTDILSGGQLVSGLLTMNPAQIAGAAAQKGIAEYIKFLNNPNRAVKNLFEDVEKVGKPTKENAVSKALTETNIGLSTKDVSGIPRTVTPASVAKNMDATDRHLIVKFLDGKTVDVDSLLKGMKIDKADEATQKAFLREALDEYEGVAEREVLQEPPTVPQPI